MKKILLLAFALVSLKLHAQLGIGEFGNGPRKFWVFYEESVEQYSDNLVVFLHGFAASNPACYGAWIRELTAAGYVVIFPKYQQGMFYPATIKFQRRVDKNIRKAFDRLPQQLGTNFQSISFVTHSLGGIIASNLANEYGASNEYQVAGMVLVQPGFKYLKLSRLDQYDRIDTKCKLLLITGDKDLTAGNKFARYLYEHSSQIEEKVLVEHYDDRNNYEKVKSDHTSPISPDRALDTGNRNVVIRGALSIGKIDQVDRHAYWVPTLRVLGSIAHEETLSSSSIPTYMGQWADHTPVKPLKIIKSSR